LHSNSQRYFLKSSTAKRHAAYLGYWKSAWNNLGTNYIEDQRFDNALILRNETTQLGFPALKTSFWYFNLVEEVWDCWVNHYSGYTWSWYSRYNYNWTLLALGTYLFVFSVSVDGKKRLILTLFCFRCPCRCRFYVGWDEKSWDSDNSTLYPKSESKKWNKLTDRERLAAEGTCVVSSLTAVRVCVSVFEGPHI
jgi:hypothetical protein